MGESKYTINNYRRLIAHYLSSGYNFGRFDGDLTKDQTVLLRHDIDYTLTFAVEFARINSQMGVAGTFFLQLRSRLYNLMDYDVQRALMEISDLGQHFGFHAVIDSNFESIDSLRAFLADDFLQFSRCVPNTTPVFAWHNPGILSSKGFNFIAEDFPGLINVYRDFGPEFVPYFADSNMRYSFDELCAFAQLGHRVIQLAIAPMQWCTKEAHMPGVMIANLLQKIVDVESGFLENYVYADMFPHGIPPKVYAEFCRLCLEAANKKE